MDGPFSKTAPAYVHLPEAPLVRTLAQIRFPTFAAFATSQDRTANLLAAALGEEFPRFDAGHELALTLTPEGVTQSQGTAPLWRFTSTDTRWQVSLGLGFLSLETSAYYRRSQFVARLKQIWDALNDIARPPVVERVGVRYVNLVSASDQLSQLSTMLRPEILGIAAISREGAEVRSALAEGHFLIEGGEEFQARWGLLPAGFSADTLIPATESPSWVLDMDSYRSWPLAGCAFNDFDLEQITSSLAGRAYQFYRWAVTDKWLRAFGGEV